MNIRTMVTVFVTAACAITFSSVHAQAQPGDTAAPSSTTNFGAAEVRDLVAAGNMLSNGLERVSESEAAASVAKVENLLESRRPAEREPDRVRGWRDHRDRRGASGK
jgi:hypothetical protein